MLTEVAVCLWRLFLSSLGGSLDITVYQQHGDDSIEEIYKETSDAYGEELIV